MISFGHFQETSNESLNNPSFMVSRTRSLGKATGIEKENEPDYMSKYRVDTSVYSRGKSNNSNERSFYKPVSPEFDSTSKNLNRMQYMPNTRFSQERPLAQDHSIERDDIRVPVGTDYQMNKIFGTQPQAQKKFQIERRTYENLQNMSSYDPIMPSKTYE